MAKKKSGVSQKTLGTGPIWSGRIGGSLDAAARLKENLDVIVNKQSGICRARAGAPMNERGLTAAGVVETIRLTRPDIINLCQGNSERFAWWLATEGGGEYKGLADFGFSLPLDRLTAPSDIALPGVAPPISRAMQLTHALRPDLQQHFDLSGADGQRRFLWWFLSSGTGVSPLHREVAQAAFRPLAESLAQEALAGVEPALTQLMVLVRDARPDLQAAFSLVDRDSQQEFVWWFFIYGLREIGCANLVTECQRTYLNAADDPAEADMSLPLTRLMMEVWRRLPRFEWDFDIFSQAGRLAFLHWFYAKGAAELGLIPLLGTAQKRALGAPVPGSDRVSMIQAMVWAADADVRARFPDHQSGAYANWCCSPEALRDFPILGICADMTPAAPSIMRRSGELPFGVNLVGYSRGQFGIGEDVRMATRAMQAAGIPFSIFNIEPGREVDQADYSVESLVNDQRPYAIDLFCTTGIDTAHLAAVHGHRLFDGRRVIGYWPWELAEWPAEWRHAYDAVDEVWASSMYTYAAYTRSCPKPVRHVPMAVAVNETAGLTRRDFRLPEGRFLFVFSFDMLSSAARKNPEACISAFRKAFPDGREPVGLVVKVMRGSTDNQKWGELARLAKEDPRIHILSGTLGKAQVLDLYRACDCFVSLHRAEGFGRGIAEAMMLGKPVLVTGYSGNMDFTTPGTAALVEFRMRVIADGDYPFGTGQVWAEPNPEHGAWWMRRLVYADDVRSRLASQGAHLVRATFSPLPVGLNYAALLRESP